MENAWVIVVVGFVILIPFLLFQAFKKPATLRTSGNAFSDTSDDAAQMLLFSNMRNANYSQGTFLQNDASNAQQCDPALSVPSDSATDSCGSDSGNSCCSPDSSSDSGSSSSSDCGSSDSGSSDSSS